MCHTLDVHEISELLLLANVIYIEYPLDTEQYPS